MAAVRGYAWILVGMQFTEDTPRFRERPIALVRRAMGRGKDVRTKLRHLREAVRGYGSTSRVEPRLHRLQELGHIDQIPTRVQRMVGAVDMMRFFIVPCAADYYDSKNISFAFHTLLRFLDDPASVIDPTGFNSSRDAIIGHVMQVVHANPRYDFQLLDSFEDGMEEMERQVRAVLDGSHPRAASIRAVVEDPTYHERLLRHIQEYRRGDAREDLVRENIHGNPDLERAERTFGTLPAAMQYFARLPRTPRGALRHLARVRRLPADEMLH